MFLIYFLHLAKSPSKKMPAQDDVGSNTERLMSTRLMIDNGINIINFYFYPNMDHHHASVCVCCSFLVI